MAVNDVHPSYSYFLENWRVCRDAYFGEKAVKDKGVTYLPATPGQIADGMESGKPGYQSYTIYKERAVFHDFMKEAVDFYLGMLWNKPPVITLPTSMEYMREKATVQGESLEQLMMRVNEQQLVAGRLGILLDLPVNPAVGVPVNPYLVLYLAENIINWDEGERDQVSPESLNLVVLNESSYKRQQAFSWEIEEKYRVLVLGDIEDNEPEGGVKYRFQLLDKDASDINNEELQAPSILGKTLDRIPFVMVNSKDIVTEPDVPPLLSLARLSMAIYRGEADYRQSLFLQGQDTLVIIGDNSDEDNKRVGAGTALMLPMDADAKFIGVDSSGLSEQRLALENDKKSAAQKAGQLISASSSTPRESGAALEKRVSGQTASLRHIATTCALSLEKILKTQAEWMGLNPAEVSVKPNLDFASNDMPAQELLQFQAAKSQGAPISSQTIHELMQRRNVTNKSYDDEISLIESEVPVGTGTDPNLGV